MIPNNNNDNSYNNDSNDISYCNYRNGCSYGNNNMFIEMMIDMVNNGTATMERNDDATFSDAVLYVALYFKQEEMSQIWI